MQPNFFGGANIHIIAMCCDIIILFGTGIECL